MRSPSTFAAVALAALLQGATAQAAGFDCAKAQSRVEKLVCARPELSRLDDELAKAFETIRKETAGIDGATGKASFSFGVEHDRWRTTIRDKCRTASCLKKAYEARLARVRRDWKDLLTTQ